MAQTKTDVSNSSNESLSFAVSRLSSAAADFRFVNGRCHF